MTSLITFRFYEELNDFLPHQRRQREFSVACAPTATTKHMIEALGVPHTEVELILVNGESVGFDRLLREGRIVLTRDRELLKLRRITHGCSGKARTGGGCRMR